MIMNFLEAIGMARTLTTKDPEWWRDKVRVFENLTENGTTYYTVEYMTPNEYTSWESVTETDSATTAARFNDRGEAVDAGKEAYKTQHPTAFDNGDAVVRVRNIWP